jgi:hypothetical protein
MKPILTIFTVILLVFLGSGAIYGGIILISDPSGNKFEWSVDLLIGTPFKDFLIPGIILLIMNGILPLIITVLIFIKARNYEWMIIIQGCILIGWLSVEIVLNSDFFVPAIHYPWYGIGLFLVFTGLIILRITKKQIK